jgi:maltose-binding protein MalE
MPAATAGTPASALIKAFGVVGTGGVPVPNVPEMSSVWAPLGKAWATSTSGAVAVPAKDAFAEAELTITTAIG